MENKEFAKQLEKRTKKFAIDIIKLSLLCPQLLKEELFEIRLPNQEPVSVQTTVRQTAQEAKQIFRTRLASLKAKRVKQFTGLKLLKN